MVTNRTNISNKFENGDIPSQSDFREIFDSFVHKDEDKATIQMVEKGTDNERYVTPALLRAGLQNVGSITGNCYFPIKESYENFNGSIIFLKESPINFSVQAFKNGQLLLEEKDYTVNYDTAILSFSSPITDRNIEVDYWHKYTNDSEGLAGNRQYKLYTALLSQSGTNAPVATVLENTLGETVVWSRNDVGKYSATLAGAFTYNNTAVFLTDSFFTTKHLRGSRQNNNIVSFYNAVITTGTLSDVIESATIEIRVYNVEKIERGKFMSTWKTDNLSTGSSTANQIKLPLIDTGTYDMIVDWGDGKTSTITTYNSTDATHTYDAAGTYNISISGVCNGWKFDYSGDRSKVINISQWGILKLGTIEGGYFSGCDNLDLSNVTDTLDLTDTTSLANAFWYCTKLTTINRCNEWIVDSITNMRSMFSGAAAFNQPIGNWNTSNVIKMSGMFSVTKAFNQPIGDWNTSSVLDMTSMFERAKAFNQDIHSWDTSKVENMRYMFCDASVFNQPIGSWDTSNVTHMEYMFRGANAFNQPIGNWNTNKVENMAGMFDYATEFNQPIGNWEMGSVTDMAGMFSNAISFNQPIGTWKIGIIDSMDSMFENATVFNQPIGTWKIGSVTSTASMFKNATSFNQPIETWTTGRVTNMSEMFSGAIKFDQNIGSWNVSKVTDFSNFMVGKTPTTFSSANLDAIYNGWITRGVKPSKSITFGTAKYTSGSVASRAILTGTPNSWSISDGGLSS